MIIKIDDLSLNYEVYGQGPRLLLLHGWGQNLQTFNLVALKLAQNFQIFALDLPGFGSSSKLPHSFGLIDYSLVIEKFLESLEIKEISLLGHSFGGAVSLYLSSFSNRIRKIVLEDSAGLYPKSFIIQLKILIYKLFRKSPLDVYKHLGALRKLLGSVDYKNSGPLRKTLIEVVNSNISYLLPRIKNPTLIIWGENDEITTIAEAKILKAGLENSFVILIPGCGHFPHLEKPDEFVKLVTDFLLD